MKQKEGNLFLQIFKDWWPKFKQDHPSYATPFYDGIIEKVMQCGDPTFGYVKYQCLHCGVGEKLVGFSCKTKFCLRCSRLCAADFISEVQSKLHSGVIYRHLILTIPSELRKYFYDRRIEPEFYNLFFKTGWACVQDFINCATGSKLKCGCLAVLHPVGRMSDYKPHLHILVMDGGIDEESGQWVSLGNFPYAILHKKWQYHLLKMLREFDPSAATNRLIDQLWKRFPRGFVAQILKGEVPKKIRKLTNYLAKYLFRPAISLRRIKYYDPQKGIVAYTYDSHKSKKSEMAIAYAKTFIGRMVQQILPHGFQRVRYYGLQATGSYKRSKEKIELAMASLREADGFEMANDSVCVEKDSDVSYGDKVFSLTGVDPLRCENCGHRLELVQVWTKSKGFVYDLLDYLETRATSPPKQPVSPQKVVAKLTNHLGQQMILPGFV